VDLDRESQDGALSDVLLDAYNTLSVAPLEVFGVGDRVYPLASYWRRYWPVRTGAMRGIRCHHITGADESSRCSVLVCPTIYGPGLHWHISLRPALP
jgi:hypothetical protein